MTTYTAQRNTTASWPLFAAVGAGLSVVLTAVGTFWDLTGNESGSSDGIVEFLPVIGAIAVATVLVFGLVVRTATPENGPRRAIVLAVLGFVSLAVFWTGLPTILASGSACCALLRLSAAAKAAIAISAVTSALAVVAAVVG